MTSSTFSLPEPSESRSLDHQNKVTLVQDSIMCSYSYMNEAARKGDWSSVQAQLHIIGQLNCHLDELNGVKKSYDEESEDSVGYSVRNPGLLSGGISISSGKASSYSKALSSSTKTVVQKTRATKAQARNSTKSRAKSR